jgi:allantoate deiminase
MNSEADPLAGEKIAGRLLDLAAFTDVPGELSRLTLSPAHRRAVDHLAALFRAAGMDAAVDPMGSLIGRLPSAAVGAKTLLIGSHIDTVRNAGVYDGNLGVLVGLAVVESLRKDGIALPFAIEVIAFGDEEGVRFPSTLTGSMALAGLGCDAWLDDRDEDGVSRREALARFGAPAPDWAANAREPAAILGYVEAHIEQGPVLDVQGLPVGVVTAINGASRAEVSVEGTAGHAGTLPMAMRRDALAAAAEMIGAIEACARQSDGTVATVGRLEVPGGAGNVIAGHVIFSLDLRAPDDALRGAAFNDICARIADIASRRRVTATVTLRHESAATHCDERLSRILEAAIVRSGIRPFRLGSGAGHDAMAFRGAFPIAMLFVRCRGGVSHSPGEYSSPSDIETSARVLRDFVLGLAAQG